jgi:hypothetical protein
MGKLQAFVQKSLDWFTVSRRRKPITVPTIFAEQPAEVLANLSPNTIE